MKPRMKDDDVSCGTSVASTEIDRSCEVQEVHGDRFDSGHRRSYLRVLVRLLSILVLELRFLPTVFFRNFEIPFKSVLLRISFLVYAKISLSPSLLQNRYYDRPRRRRIVKCQPLLLLPPRHPMVMLLVRGLPAFGIVLLLAFWFCWSAVNGFSFASRSFFSTVRLRGKFGWFKRMFRFDPFGVRRLRQQMDMMRQQMDTMTQQMDTMVEGLRRDMQVAIRDVQHLLILHPQVTNKSPKLAPMVQVRLFLLHVVTIRPSLQGWRATGSS
jgi:hypothetical protein